MQVWALMAFFKKLLKIEFCLISKLSIVVLLAVPFQSFADETQNLQLGAFLEGVTKSLPPDGRFDLTGFECSDLTSSGSRVCEDRASNFKLVLKDRSDAQSVSVFIVLPGAPERIAREPNGYLLVRDRSDFDKLRRAFLSIQRSEAFSQLVQCVVEPKTEAVLSGRSIVFGIRNHRTGTLMILAFAETNFPDSGSADQLGHGKAERIVGVVFVRNQLDTACKPSG